MGRIEVVEERFDASFSKVQSRGQGLGIERNQLLSNVIKREIDPARQSLQSVIRGSGQAAGNIGGASCGARVYHGTASINRSRYSSGLAWGSICSIATGALEASATPHVYTLEAIR